jgi:hypothetical protein
VKKGPIGVWLSLAFVIFGLSGWLGSKLGARISVYWFQSSQRKAGNLSDADRVHLESVLTALDKIQTLELYSAFLDDQELRKKYYPTYSANLEKFKRSTVTQEMQPVVDFYLGAAYVTTAMAEEQDGDKALAEKNMKLAQHEFQSLGWQDYSEEVLQTAARKEFGWGIGQSNSK